MDNQTYKKIQKLLLLFGIIICVVMNIKQIISYSHNLISVFTPFITGICIAFILNLLMQKIELFIHKFAKKKSRVLSILITIIIFVLSLTLIFYMIIPEVSNSLAEITNNFPKLLEEFEKFLQEPNNDIVKNISSIGVDFDKIVNNIVNFFKNFSIVDATNALQSILSVTSNLFSTLMNLFLGIIFAIYILLQKEELLSQGKSLIQSIFDEKTSKNILNFLDIVNTSFSKFIAGQGTEAIILGLLFFISMNILRLPKALSVSATIGVFSLVPIVGAFIGALYGSITILIVSPIKALYFLILFLVLQQIEGNLIYPKVVGKSVGLPGIWVLLAITVGGNLLGLVGMILSVPIMSIIYTLVSIFIKSRKNRK